MPEKKIERAIDILERAKIDNVFSDGELVIQAARLHDSCPDCHGAGGAFHPEQPCPGCGLTVFDSFGLEGVQR